MAYWVAQPYGKDRGRESSRISEHPTITAAFEAIDRLLDQMRRTGAPDDAIEPIVVTEDRQVVSRPGTH